MLRTLLACCVLTFALACGYDPPADHTESHGGYMHKPGGQQAMDNCTTCHGADLKGDQGPSCYTCHGQQWQ